MSSGFPHVTGALWEERHRRATLHPEVRVFLGPKAIKRIFSVMLVGSSSQKSQLAPGQGCGGTQRVLRGTPACGDGTDHATWHLLYPPRFGKKRRGERKKEEMCSVTPRGKQPEAQPRGHPTAHGRDGSAPPAPPDPHPPESMQ